MTAICTKCKGTGEIGINAKTCQYVSPGPVPEYARGIARSACFECLGTGFVERDETNPFAPLDNKGWLK